MADTFFRRVIPNPSQPSKAVFRCSVWRAPCMAESGEQCYAALAGQTRHGEPSESEGEQVVVIALYGVAATIATVGAVYWARKSRDVRKFLAGAFFVSSGIQFYLYLAGVSIPLLGTEIVQTPYLSAVRSVVHLVLSVVCIYFGFLKAPRTSSP